MTVVDKKPVPIYEITCQECGSIIRYQASEVSWCHISCPICKVSNWANTICPVDYIDREEPGQFELKESEVMIHGDETDSLGYQNDARS